MNAVPEVQSLQMEANWTLIKVQILSQNGSRPKIIDNLELQRRIKHVQI